MNLLLLVTSGNRETNRNILLLGNTFEWVNLLCVFNWRTPVAVLQLYTGWQTSPQRRPALPQSARAPPAAVLCCHGNQTVQGWGGRCKGSSLSPAAANGTAPSNQMRLHNELVMQSPHGCSACVLGPV